MLMERETHMKLSNGKIVNLNDKTIKNNQSLKFISYSNKIKT